ncbi:uncharacterized protein LOC125037532 [Penaeus chinensis]|uniref:uncharacterized protein LOC125037532 n=1 Tax=Penaeus chinensis TaxID=139456 RepID=UPI001FB69465|nr:uncharacterized protein LOC125037532 [Penaeus chinensis]
MEMFKAGHDIGCKQTGGRYRYNTVKPLNPEHVEQALRHYQRKIPNCRCFLKKRDGKLWVCEDPNPEIDFEKSLASFTAKCRANGVTFNSGMEAVINTAIVEMAREAGVEGEAHHMSINLATDLRRYMKRRPLPILGLHVRPTVHRMETPFDVRDNFWDYTRKLHQRLSVLLKSGEALQQSVVREMTLQQLPPVEHHAAGIVAHLDYGLINVGDLTAVIPGVGEQLQQTDLAMIGCTHSFGFPMLHQIYTFRGHSPYTLAYDPSYMAKETAVVITDRILRLMHDLGTSP